MFCAGMFAEQNGGISSWLYRAVCLSDYVQIPSVPQASDVAGYGHLCCQPDGSQLYNQGSKCFAAFAGRSQTQVTNLVAYQGVLYGLGGGS